MHNLHKHQPDEDTLQKMINNVPSSLSYADDDRGLPIRSAVVSMEGVHYVPLLAKEGVKHKVGGDDARGRLIGDNNVLILLLSYTDDTYDVGDDTSYLNAMKELRESNLFHKKDIKEHNLLYWACDPDHQMRFDYLADWCPEGLKTHTYCGLPVIHAIIKFSEEKYIEDFPTFLVAFLEASLKHHPDDLGLLFQKDREGQTACERAFKQSGKDETLKAIGEFIPFDDPKIPILHHVAKHAPQFMKDFGSRYPSATYFRDCKGRTLQQTTLASGHKTFGDDPMFFLQMSDEQVREIDPGSDLYPFMVAASGQTSDYHYLIAISRREEGNVTEHKVLYVYVVYTYVYYFSLDLVFISKMANTLAES